MMTYIKFFFYFIALFHQPLIAENLNLETRGGKMVVDQAFLKRLILARYNEKEKKFIIKNKMQLLEPSEYIYDVEISPSGQFYLMTTKGISILNNSFLKTERIFEIAQFPTRDINDLFIDDQGFLYVASAQGLFVSKDQGKSFKLKKSDGLGPVSIKSVLIDSKKNYYLGTESGLLVSLDRGQTFKNFLIDPQEPGSNKNYFYHCFLSKQGSVACTTWHGVFIFDRKTRLFKETPIGSAQISQLGFDSQGRLYGVHQSSVYRSDDHLTNFKSHKDDWGLKDFTIDNIFLDTKDRIFVYSYTDLSIKETKRENFKKLTISDSFDSLNAISKIVQTPAGEIYLISWMHPFGDTQD